VNLQWRGKRALVTGSSIGVGEAIARALVAEGVSVAIHARQIERTHAVATEIEARGGKSAVVLETLRPKMRRRRPRSAIEQLGAIDILINNAGGTGEKLVCEDTPIRGLDRVYD
jgi:3-oxoacyl-[acyl-carrier protein] reductase